ncbi:hypothetical protein GCM10011490_18330 [Pseudoclavibacter endophyticus]|nr:hypothetical protein GCM10011490_18330 [Pseudoclavibacter endophyticus]
MREASDGGRTMTVGRARFARLLRWYPKGWRERNGEVLLGAMLDEAERNGRDRPTAAEWRSAVVHGLGARLDRTWRWRARFPHC